jgi:hypothetical protein
MKTIRMLVSMHGPSEGWDYGDVVEVDDVVADALCSLPEGDPRAEYVEVAAKPEAEAKPKRGRKPKETAEAPAPESTEPPVEGESADAPPAPETTEDV